MRSQRSRVDGDITASAWARVTSPCCWRADGGKGDRPSLNDDRRGSWSRLARTSRSSTRRMRTRTLRCSCGGAGVGDRGGACAKLSGMQHRSVGGDGAGGAGDRGAAGRGRPPWCLGSRDRDRAAQVVDELRARWGDRVAGLEPGTNHDAADAEVVVLATVWDAAVADRAGPRRPARRQGRHLDGERPREAGPRVPCPVLPPQGSIAPRRSRPPRPARSVVAAFHHVPAAALGDLDRAARRATCSSSATTTARTDRARPRSTASPACGPSTPDRSRTRSASRPFAAALLTDQPPAQGRGDAADHGRRPRPTAA